jgi:hypothetical protein
LFVSPNPAPDSGSDDGFADNIATVGNRIIVGAHKFESFTGIVWVFDGDTGEPLGDAISKPEDASPSDHFGDAVAGLGDRIAVGTPFDLSDSPIPNSHSGTVYLFDAETQEPGPSFISPTPGSLGFFGDSLEVTANNLVVGAPGDAVGDEEAGRVHLLAAARVNSAALLNDLTSLRRLSLVGHGFSTAEDISDLVKLEQLYLDSNDPSQAPLIETDAAITSVPEGGTMNVGIQLHAQPDSDVEVTVMRIDDDIESDGNLTIAGGASLTFTPTDWDQPQDVTFAAGEDMDAIDGRERFLVSAPGWISRIITVTEADNDRRVVLDTTSLTVAESESVAFQVRLAGQPSGPIDVSISRTSGDGDLQLDGPGNLRFTPENWDAFQIVTLFAADASV